MPIDFLSIEGRFLLLWLFSRLAVLCAIEFGLYDFACSRLYINQESSSQQAIHNSTLLSHLGLVSCRSSIVTCIELRRLNRDVAGISRRLLDFFPARKQARVIICNFMAVPELNSTAMKLPAVFFGDCFLFNFKQDRFHLTFSCRLKHMILAKCPEGLFGCFLSLSVRFAHFRYSYSLRKYTISQLQPKISPIHNCWWRASSRHTTKRAVVINAQTGISCTVNIINVHFPAIFLRAHVGFFRFPT